MPPAALAGPTMAPRIEAHNRTEHLPDGRVVVYDVPVFAEHERTFPNGRTLKVDRPWLERALSTDRDRRADGYRAPIHLGHHNGFADRARVGLLELSYIADRMVDGEARAVLFGTLFFDGEDEFTSARKYQYRSVEISPRDPREINSLALLSSEAPYFRFPNLAYRAGIGGGMSYFWSDGVTKEQIEEARKLATSSVPYEADPEPEPEPEDPEESKGEPEYADQHEVAEIDHMKALHEKMDKILELLTEPRGHGAAPSDVAAAHSSGGSAPMIAAQADARPITYAADVARLEGQISGLTSRLDGVTKAREADQRFHQYREEMVGYALSGNWEAELAKRCSDGTAESWVAGIKSSAPKIPGFEDAATASPDTGAAMQYSALGEDYQREAERLLVLYHNSKPSSLIRRQSPEKFLESQLGPATVEG